MRMIAIILAILPLTAVLAEDEQVELPRNIERLFDKSDEDNREAVAEVAEAIRERNDRLMRDVEQQIQRNRALREAKETYDTLISNGISDEQIMETANADVQAVAAIYTRLDAEMAKGPADYVAEEDGNGTDLLVEEPINIIGTWAAVHPRWRDTLILNEDGTIVRGGRVKGQWTLEGNTLTLRWSGFNPEKATWNGTSFEGDISLTKQDK